MNKNFFQSLSRWAALLMCCLVLTAAHAQDTSPPAEAPAITAEARATSAEGQTTTFDDDERGSWKDHHKHHHHSHSDDVVSIGRKAELLAGERADSVVAVFGSATSAGEVGDAVVSVIGSTRVTGGKVGESAVAVMGSVYVNGEVNGDVVAVMGSVELGPEARVHGDVVVVGGEIKRDADATVDGHVQNVLGVDWADFGWMHPWVERCLLYGRPLAFSPGLGWAWGIALGLLALYAFMAFVFRGAVDKCVHTLETEPGHSILAALLLTLGIPVLFVLLVMTVLGIAAVPFLAVAVIFAAMFGKVVVLAAIGKRCTPALAGNPTMHTVVGVVVGGLIVMVIYTIPLVGFVVYKLLELLGLGVVVYALLLNVRAGRLARAGTGGGPGSGGGPGVAAGSGPGTGGAAAAGTPGFSGGNTAGFSRAEAESGGTAGFAGGTAESSAAAGFTGDTAGRGATAGSTGAAADEPAREAPSPPPPPQEPHMNASATQPPLNAAVLPRAGFGIRMVALLLDVILIGILTHQVYHHGDFHLLLLGAYGAVMWKLKGATIGGIICGLQVVRVDGRPIDWPTAIVRALSCFLSLAVVGLGFIWIAIDQDRQGWHDKIAGTAVVRAPKGASLL